jgi:hypothetical protein
VKQTAIKIGNVRTVFNRFARRAGFEPGSQPGNYELDQTLKFAASKGVYIQHPDGRAYPEFVPSPPAGKRWQNGRLVPRFSKR